MRRRHSSKAKPSRLTRTPGSSFRASRPRPATVYEHSRLAIDYTLEHLGENGLPLLRAGDWNDGIDVLGRRGIGTSVWMGFFLFNVLDGFIPLARTKGDETFATRCEAALEAERKALEVGWRGDHYVLDFADDGRALDLRNAMTSGWAAYSGACDDERALAALEGGLKGIERPNRVLLMESHSTNIRSLIPAASPIIRRACVRMAANIATARPGSSMASCASPPRPAPKATANWPRAQRRALSRYSKRSRR